VLGIRWYYGKNFTRIWCSRGYFTVFSMER
jgi:hypothetical protein